MSPRRLFPKRFLLKRSFFSKLECNSCIDQISAVSTCDVCNALPILPLTQWWVTFSFWGVKMKFLDFSSRNPGGLESRLLHGSNPLYDLINQTQLHGRGSTSCWDIGGWNLGSFPMLNSLSTLTLCLWEKIGQSSPVLTWSQWQLFCLI